MMKTPIYKRWLFWLIIVFAILTVIIGVTSEDTVEDNEDIVNNDQHTENTDVPSDTTITKTTYKLNETFSDTIQSVTITAVEDWTGYTEFTAPTAGLKIIRIYVKYANISSSTDTYIYSGDFDCYVDDKVCESYIFHEDVADLKSGSISPGRKTEGWIYFQVPTTYNSIELEYETIGLFSNRVTFELN